nr:hypothetical protein [Tanacetum cinerariifolium]
MISAQVGDLSSHTTKYTSPALTEKCQSKADDDVVANDVIVDDVSDVVAHAATEPTPPSPIPSTTPPPLPSQELPSTSQDDELEPADLKEAIKAVTTAKLMIEVVTAAATTITATPITAATITTAPSATRRRKGVVIRDPKKTATPSTIVHSEPKSKDKGKGILVEEPK